MQVVADAFDVRSFRTLSTILSTSVSMQPPFSWRERWAVADSYEGAWSTRCWPDHMMVSNLRVHFLAALVALGFDAGSDCVRLLGSLLDADIFGAWTVP
eukprot:11677092-Karenia_brevis.AAC.1